MKTRIEKTGKFFWLSFPIVMAIFCSSCGTIGQHIMPSYPPVKSPVYIGTCGDVGEIFSKEKGQPIITRAVCCVDLPFSLVADTLWLPFDLYDYHLHVQEANLLKGWTFKQYERDRVGNVTNPFEQVIDNDYQAFLKQNNLDSMGMVSGFYKNDTGQYGAYAVEFEAMPRGERDSYHYYLFYDKNGKRFKVKKYYYGHYSC